MKFITDYFTELWILTLAMSPYLLLGFAFAGILKAWFPKQWIERYLSKSDFRSVLNAAILGIPIPLCSCGVIPTGVSLHKNGASKGASVSFLISTPQTGVDSILVTYSMLGLPFALMRVLAALVSGVLGGWLTILFAHDKTQKSSAHFDACKKEVKNVNSFLTVIKYGFYELLMDIAKWLIIGLALAALIAILVPDDFFLTYASNSFVSMLIALLISVPLYICATGSVPIAAVLLLKGLSPGAALVILMAGPATNIATITVIKKIFGNKTLITYLASIVGGAFLFGTIIDQLLPKEWFGVVSGAIAGHCETGCEDGSGEISLIAYLSAFLLIGLIINGYVQKYLIKSDLEKKTIIKPQALDLSVTKCSSIPQTPKFGNFKPVSSLTTVLKVTGMTCSHCKNSVETNVGKLPNVQSVVATPAQDRVVITGSNLNIEEIKSTINGLGYNCVD